jgi:PTH1 family peptidyl-tRNA hydrolase
MNRHNAGFMLIDRLLAEYELALDKSQGNALLAVRALESGSLVLAKPQTYVNESGRSVASLMRSFDVELPNLLVAFDDLDLPLGLLRMRPSGGSSGHHGMRSIINHLGDHGFPRLRLGIGRPPGRMDPARFVLADFSADEIVDMEFGFDRAVKCVRQYVAADIQLAMNECNSANGPGDAA